MPTRSIRVKRTTSSALAYRLAVRALSVRCRGDRQFRLRAETLILQFGKDLPAVIEEAEKISADPAASVSGVRRSCAPSSGALL
jgi:hypothetical protein